MFYKMPLNKNGMPSFSHIFIIFSKPLTLYGFRGEQSRPRLLEYNVEEEHHNLVVHIFATFILAFLLFPNDKAIGTESHHGPGWRKWGCLRNLIPFGAVRNTLLDRTTCYRVDVARAIY